MTDTSSRTSGTLYIVATPIGHLDDITLRALSTLKSVDVIFAEDTRHSSHLLNALGIKKPLHSLHAHNEAQKSEQVIAALKSGQSCALISDAGTPLISDPGYPLVKLAQTEDILVVPIPGPCALITALSAAGVACDIFTFCGFLPAKSSQRKERLSQLSEVAHTLVFYESTHRILDTIDDIALVFGAPCELVLAKELTKTHERFIAGNCNFIREWLMLESHSKGEFVLLIPPRAIKPPEERANHQLLSVLLGELPLKQAVKLAAQLSSTSKNELYQLALTIRDDKNGPPSTI